MISKVPFSLLAISDLRQLEGSPEAWLGRLGDAGIPAVQWREKHLSDRELLASALRARRSFAGRLLLNGRCDIAAAVAADGVHLPAAGLPLPALRRLWGDQLLWGRSTHRVEEVFAARRDGADYVTFGPIYSTPSKASFGPPVGLEELSRAAAIGVPVLALGGVTLERLGEVAAAGAAGAAAIRLFMTDTRHLAELVAAARHHFPATHEPAPARAGVSTVDPTS